MTGRSLHGAVLYLAFSLVPAVGCSARGGDDDDGRFHDGGTDDTDTGDGGGGGNEDSGDDTDTDTGTGNDNEPIIPSCAGCPAVGDGLEEMRCAVDLCAGGVVLDQEYTSPTVPNRTDDTHAAVERFGKATNGLEPLLNGSYALMATGPAKGTAHDKTLGPLLGGKSVPDPFDKQYPTYDVMEWRLHLQAPPEANGILIHYVFFSEEYDEYVASQYNDKFYIFLEAGSTDGGKRTVINFTECRNPGKYFDFECSAEQAARKICEQGKKYCYIAINTALSECCWYGGCPNGTWTTDISGTGFSCAAGQGSDSAATGSSTGWLYTGWPIQPGEEFEIIFHIHDTSDGALDSEVIIDKLLFMKKVKAGTGPVK